MCIMGIQAKVENSEGKGLAKMCVSSITGDIINRPGVPGAVLQTPL